MKRIAGVVAAYAWIAVVSSAANIAVQALVIALYHGDGRVPVSVLAGTAAGLPIKYVLEKRHVFGFRTRDLGHDGRLFVVYTFFGGFTTLLFWGTEWLFHHAYGTDAMRYAGAALGLTLGYILRYQLDRRYVFVERGAEA